MNENYFSTTETPVSKYHPESGVSFITVKSPALRQRGDICFFQTSQAKGKRNVPLVLLLHGVYGSHWAWMFKGGAHKTAQRLVDEDRLPPLVVACPSDGLWGDGSGYVCHQGQDFEAWIVQDVIQAMIENVDCVSKESKKYISGLSMGGFGALRLGAKYPNVFETFGGHSSITHFSQMSQFVEEPLVSYDCKEEDKDVLKQIITNKSIINRFRFDCGSEDQLIDYNRELHRKLEALQINHEYQENAGSHEWPYWEKHLESMLLFFLGN